MACTVRVCRLSLKVSHITERTLTLEYWQDGDWYVGQLQEIPAVVSQGRTLEELEENIRDAFELFMAERSENSHPNAKARPIAVHA